MFKRKDQPSEVEALRLQVAHLELRLKQQEELHAEWLQTMRSMHGAAVETLERIRIGEAHGRATVESLLEVGSNGGRR